MPRRGCIGSSDGAFLILPVTTTNISRVFLIRRSIRRSVNPGCADRCGSSRSVRSGSIHSPGKSSRGHFSTSRKEDGFRLTNWFWRVCCSMRKDFDSTSASAAAVARWIDESEILFEGPPGPRAPIPQRNRLELVATRCDYLLRT